MFHRFFRLFVLLAVFRVESTIVSRSSISNVEENFLPFYSTSDALLLRTPTFQPTAGCGPNQFPTVEYNALYDLYQSTNGDSWIWETNYASDGYPWNFTTGVTINPCLSFWQGIACYGTCHVKMIELIDLNLDGTLPESIGLFPHLTTLWIAQNDQLTGTIPSTVGNLTNLQLLDLYSNALTGTVPLSLFNLSHITSFYLYDNLLTGSLPSSSHIWQPLASTITNFGLEQNLITGTLPAAIGKLTKLQNLCKQIN